MHLKGSFVALVSPMQKDKSGNLGIDYKSYENLLNYHLENNTNGLVILGTTGESNSFDSKEKQELIKFSVNKIKNKLPIIIGTGSNNTNETLKNTKIAKELGADAVLVVTPYYNKPTQEGLFLHYEAVATGVDIPIILYNVPSRTACDLQPSTVEKLLKYKNIIAIKEAKADLERYKELVQISQTCEREFFILSGDDLTAIELMKIGGHGVISVTANIAAKDMANLCANVFKDKVLDAEKLQKKLVPLHENLFIESNPVPVKWALFKMGLISNPDLRLPLTILSANNQEIVFKAMSESGII